MRGWACFVLVCHQQERIFGGWERSRAGGIETNTWHRPGTWLQKKLENLSAAPDELDETSPPIFVFRMTYFCPSSKPPSPCFQYVLTTVVVLIRQPRQNIHTSTEA